jgi:four helix bundle protein
MKPEFDLKIRTKKFAIDVLNLCEKIYTYSPKKYICDQLARSAGSVGSNYRAACRPKSNKDFINKLRIILEEADESMFWLEIINETYIDIEKQEVERLIKESNELCAIFVKSIKTTNESIKKTIEEKKKPKP